jgi:hypothetical protein
LCFGGFVVFLTILAQAVVLIFFYDLPSKLDAYGKATARMREQRDAMVEEAKHLENKRIALQNENFRLGKEREALESSTRKMLVEKGALESAIRRSELERSRLEQEKQLLEGKRQSLAQEKEELREEGKRLREERKKWEKAREDRVPQGAFWGVIRPAEDCRAYGTREYRATLQNIPEDWTNLDACMNMPVEIKGVSIRRPLQCEHLDFSHIQAVWMVDWDQPDCKPWHNEITDTVSVSPLYPTPLTNANFKGCTNPGSGTRRLEAQIMGINEKPTQDWRLLCETTPMTWNHITYNSPTHCEAGVSTVFTRILRYHPNMLTGHRLFQWFGKKFAVWEIADENC